LEVAFVMVKQAGALNWLARGARALRGTANIPIGRALSPDLGEMALRQPKINWLPRSLRRNARTLPVAPDGGDAAFRPQPAATDRLRFGDRSGSL
jgi:hypothetical protein